MAYEDIIYKGESMKDIGSKFKEKREIIGVKIKEVCEDLNVTEAQLENLEEGNINAFKDIFFLRELVEKYSKYLDLNSEDIMNSFNASIFDYTSKIPVKELEEKMKEIERQEKEVKKMASPYTKNIQPTSKLTKILIISIIILSIILIIIVIATIITKGR